MIVFGTAPTLRSQLEGAVKPEWKAGGWLLQAMREANVSGATLAKGVDVARFSRPKGKVVDTRVRVTFGRGSSV